MVAPAGMRPGQRAMEVTVSNGESLLRQVPEHDSPNATETTNMVFKLFKMLNLQVVSSEGFTVSETEPRLDVGHAYL